MRKKRKRRANLPRTTARYFRCSGRSFPNPTEHRDPVASPAVLSRHIISPDQNPHRTHKMTDTLPNITLESGPNPAHSIIWLHGLGADGEDFVPIAEELELPVAVRYIFPHAPMRPVTINGGYVMRAWYDILIGAASAELSASIGKNEDARGIIGAQGDIEKLIAQERQRGIPAKNIFLAGFSQGGAVALYTGLR